MDENKINTAISAWFEPKPDDNFEEEKCYSAKFFWTRENSYHEVRPWTSNYDYFTSEDANARLLEAMKNPERNTGVGMRYKTAFRVWEVYWYNLSFESADRKTAVVLGFLKCKGIEP